MRVALLVSLIALGGTIAAHAQYGGYGGGRGMRPYYNAVGPGSYHHASTAAEGAARGMADVIRSKGAANLMNSEAAINLQEAQKKNIENHLQYTQTYFQMKQINQQYQAAQRKPAPDQQQAIRMSQVNIPDRLSANKMDPLTGDLAWPNVLRMDTFSDERARLDQIYSERADKGFLTADQDIEVRKLTGAMRDKLQTFAAELGSSARMEATKFLRSLDYEARFQAG